MIRPPGIAAIALSLVAVSCATTHGASSLPNVQPTSIPFTASSMPSTYGIQVRLEGSLVVRDGWLYLVVPTGAVRTYQGTADAWDLMLRAGLATCIGKGKWQIVSESRAARIASLVGMTRDNAMLDTTTRAFEDTLRLDLGVPRGTNLDRAWLTFEMAWPIESVLATYALSANGPLAASSQRSDAKPSRTACAGTGGRQPRANLSSRPATPPRVLPGSGSASRR